MSQARREMAKQRRRTRMRRCVVAHAEACRNVVGHRTDAILLTPTYRPGAEYSPRHVSRLIDLVRNYCARRGVRLRYQWVMELQRRGAPHYHLLLWVPKGFRLPKPDDCGWWPHGMTNIKLARKAVGYLVKYATKGDDDLPFPEGARLFGTGGEPTARVPCHRAGLPRWLDTVATPGTRVYRQPYVGWVERDTGVVHTTPYTMLFHATPGGCRLTVISQFGAEPVRPGPAPGFSTDCSEVQHE